MTKKTRQLLIDRINAKQLEKSEIHSLTKCFNNIRWSRDEKDKETREHLKDLLEERLTKKPIQLTKKQTQIGIEWLKRFCFKVNGQPRKPAIDSGFSEYELKVVKTFKRLEFVGMLEACNSFGEPVKYQPLYKVIGRTGSFVYCPLHWSMPILLTNAVYAIISPFDSQRISPFRDYERRYYE